jgi:hypothetical protein
MGWKRRKLTDVARVGDGDGSVTLEAAFRVDVAVKPAACGRDGGRGKQSRDGHWSSWRSLPRPREQSLAVCAQLLDTACSNVYKTRVVFANRLADVDQAGPWRVVGVAGREIDALWDPPGGVAEGYLGVAW